MSSINSDQSLIKLVFKITFVVAMAIAITPSLAIAKRPKPPKTGTPAGNTTPGTTRPEASCPETPKPLTALVANQGEDFTVAEHPTWLFYIPYTAQEISMMEFLILDRTQTKTIYHTSIKLNDKPGIIQIQLPPEADNSLAVNTTYSWRFNLDCEPDQTLVPDLILQGWIRRIPLDSEVTAQLKSATSPEYLVYQQHRIWHDAITSLAKLHFANPADSEITKAWVQTLKSLKLEWVTTEPSADLHSNS